MQSNEVKVLFAGFCWGGDRLTLVEVGGERHAYISRKAYSSGKLRFKEITHLAKGKSLEEIAEYSFDGCFRLPLVEVGEAIYNAALSA